MNPHLNKKNTIVFRSSPEPKAGLDPSCETILDIRPSLHGSCPTSPVFNTVNNFKLRSRLFEDVLFLIPWSARC